MGEFIAAGFLSNVLGTLWYSRRRLEPGVRRGGIALPFMKGKVPESDKEAKEMMNTVYQIGILAIALAIILGIMNLVSGNRY